VFSRGSWVLVPNSDYRELQIFRESNHIVKSEDLVSLKYRSCATSRRGSPNEGEVISLALIPSFKRHIAEGAYKHRLRKGLIE
jgi:hypothetical protein